MADKAPIIVIKRKKIVAGGAHGGAWKVAYADFVTAMMCFFLVMWLLGAEDEVKDAVSHYFNNPTSAWRPDLLNPNQVPLGDRSGAGENVVNGADGAIPEDLIERPSKPNVEAPPGTVKLADEAHGLSPNLAPPADLKIDTMQFSLPEEALFSAGSARLTPQAAAYLSRLRELLRNYDGEIEVKGFTEPLERGGGDPYEFALSRAVALADHFTEQRWVDRARVRTVIIDPRVPDAPDAPRSGPKRALQVTLQRAR